MKGKTEARLTRAREIERLWEEDHSIKEMAVMLDMDKDYLHVELNRLRREGLADLPRRGRGAPRKT